MSFLRPIQWYHSQADPIWPDGTLNVPTITIFSGLLVSLMNTGGGGGGGDFINWWRNLKGKVSSYEEMRECSVIYEKFFLWALTFGGIC
jgi:hypothetical protein